MFSFRERNPNIILNRTHRDDFHRYLLEAVQVVRLEIFTTQTTQSLIKSLEK